MAQTWNDRLKALQQGWQRLTLNQKMLVLLAGVTLAAVAAGMAYFGTRPEYAVLYNNLAAQDASEVVDKLRERKVPFRLGGGGTQVEVPAPQVYELRIELAGQGLPRGEGVGFEIFDKLSLGVTNEVQRINYLRALQSELERTIEALEPIQKARVHLVLPQEEMWFEEDFNPSASVMVRLKGPGTLNAQQVESIRHLLASAVRGLVPERVTVVDTQGKVLSAGADNDAAFGLSDRQIAYRQKIESNLKAQAESLLVEILGPGRAAVRVQAEMDFNQIVKEREYFEPVVGQKGLVRSEQQNSAQTGEGAPAPAGPAGTASNLQGYPPSGVSTAGNGSKKSERIIQYEMNRTHERVTSAAGTIKRLSVGVFIDGNQTPERLSDMQSVLVRALGIDPERGDLIEVRALPFDRKDTKEEQQLLEKSQREKFWLTLLSSWVPRGVLFAVAVAVLLAGLGVLRKQASLPPNMGGNGRPEDVSRLEPDRVMEIIRQHPAETSQILKQWLS
ncbi:MAG: flagellar basal-body MS-ring/collar protein FliF [candidate division FCPU426 bacterium]